MKAFTIKLIRISASLIVTLATIYTISAAQVRWKLDTVVSAGKNCLGIAATSDGSRILVTNANSPGTMSILSTTNYALLGTVSSIGAYPEGIAVTTDSKTAYIAASVPWGIRGVSLSNDSVIGTFATPCVGTTLYGIAVTPGGKTIVFPDLSSGCTVEGIRLINGISASSTFISAGTGGETYGIAIAPDSVSAFVTTFITTTSVKRINLSTSVVQTIPSIGPSYGVAITHAGDRAIITSDSVKIVSLATNQVTGAINFGSNTYYQNIAVTPNDSFAFAVGDFSVGVLSLTGDSVCQSFSATGENVAISPDGTHAYVTDSYNGQVRVYGTDTISGVIPRAELLPSEDFQEFIPSPYSANQPITFSIPRATYVAMRLYNLSGKEVATLAAGPMGKGKHQTSWSADGMAKGVYFCRLTVGSVDRTMKLIYR